MYVLDEPTTGLHFADIEVLLAALTDLRDQGNTVVVIEHNLDVVACSDWVIDLGPEGGEGGGEIVARRHAVEKRKSSGERTGGHTGRYLREDAGEERTSEPRSGRQGMTHAK